MGGRGASSGRREPPPRATADLQVVRDYYRRNNIPIKEHVKVIDKEIAKFSRNARSGTVPMEIAYNVIVHLANLSKLYEEMED